MNKYYRVAKKTNSYKPKRFPYKDFNKDFKQILWSYIKYKRVVCLSFKGDISYRQNVDLTTLLCPVLI